jgi:hypothetical protein
MTPAATRLLFWTPRVLGIAYVIFISLFALDVFAEHAGFVDTAIALALHLIPSAVAAAALLVAWRWEGAGALFYAVAAVAYMFMARRLDWILVISGPLIVVAILFLMNQLYRRELRAGR